MPELIESPTLVEAAGTPPKTIREYVGNAPKDGVTTGEPRLSIAHMTSPSGWAEPGQRPDFDEFTVVLRGVLLVEHDGGHFQVNAGQAVHTKPGEWVRYSTPGPDGADYIAVCLPGFTPDSVHRDE